MSEIHSSRVERPDKKVEPSEEAPPNNESVSFDKLEETLSDIQEDGRNIDSSVIIDREIQGILRAGAADLSGTLQGLEQILSPENLNRIGLTAEQQRVVVMYATRNIGDRTFFETSESVSGHYAGASQEEQSVLKDRQSQKLAWAWQLYRTQFGERKLSEQEQSETQSGYGMDAKKLQREILHQLMEFALDPDFRDEEIAKQIYDAIDVPAERDRYGQREKLPTLRETRLRLFDYQEANCLESPSDAKCMDAEVIQKFLQDENGTIRFGNVEVSQREFQRARQAAEIRMDTTFAGLMKFLSDGRYKTINESPEAQALWEKANQGYYHRRVKSEKRMGIHAKGTQDDEHVVSGYLHIPGGKMGPRDGQFGSFRIRLKKDVIQRSGFTKSDAFVSMGDSRGMGRLKFDAAVVYSFGQEQKLSKPGFDRTETYMEAQIFGGVTADDVEDIEIGDLSPAERRSLRSDALSSLGEVGLKKIMELYPMFRETLLSEITLIKPSYERKLKAYEKLLVDFDPESEFDVQEKKELEEELPLRKKEAEAAEKILEWFPGGSSQEE